MSGRVYEGGTVDRTYCASSFLMHRTIVDRGRRFSAALPPRLYVRDGEPEAIHDSAELEASLRRQVAGALASGRCALALSGGIDSTILAKMMPKGSKAYTFKCVVPGMEVTDETKQAARYAAECGLDHEVVEVTWEDMEGLAPQLMRHKGAPIHSIEVQAAKASVRAREEGFDTLIFGESADCNYGGLSNIFGREWLFGEYVERYSYVMPYRALRESALELAPFERHVRTDGTVDVLGHFRDEFFVESMGSYENATSWGGVALCCPYAETRLAVPLDYGRIRAGENKYLVREVFERLYPGWEAPVKTPMPRPVEQWLAGWEGPRRPEFWPHCAGGLTGDQRWLLWSLERFLDVADEADAALT